MPDSLDTITVLPKMSSPKEKGHVFRLYWVLDLVTDSSRCFISLLFKNIKTGYVLIDTIPPELLSYCTVGSCFRNGKKFILPPIGKRLNIKIDSTADNHFIDAGEAFSDIEYDLSLSEKMAAYSAVSKRQSCFMQQVGDTKIVIPWFVIAATYYFKSTSLRNAILSRKLDSLFYYCNPDNDKRHVEIFLKPEGNLGDAKSIARFKLGNFANQRLNQCANHLYANKNAPYKRLRMDFPVEQELSIEVRGRLVDDPAGGKTIIVFQILRDDSRYPFDSIEIFYEKEETITEDQETYPANQTKHNHQLSNRPPSDGLVRHLLESCDKVENKFEKEIEEKRTAVPKLPAEKTSQTVFDDNETGLSLQPGNLNDLEVSPGDLREKDDSDKTRHALSLNDFKKITDTLKDYSFTMKSGKDRISVQVTDYNYTEDLVCTRHQKATYLTLKESYDNTRFNRRRCAYVYFRCQGRYVCLVEIDQEGFSKSGCSTMVLISDEKFDKAIAEISVKGFVQDDTHPERAGKLASYGVALKTKNHPPAYDDETLNAWRRMLLRKVMNANPLLQV